ncbi:MAG: PQQ-binding-like beta-propeller repeat protein [Leadbetterella sp.]
MKPTHIKAIPLLIISIWTSCSTPSEVTPPTSKTTEVVQQGKDTTTKKGVGVNIISTNSDKIVVLDDNGNCILADAKDGDVLWKVNFPNTYFNASPCFSNGQIFIGADFNSKQPKLIALDLDSGTKKWEFDLKYDLYSTPIIKNNKIYLVSNNWNESNAVFYCLNAKNGEVIWQTDIPSLIDSSPTIKDDNIYIGSINGITIINSLTGKNDETYLKKLRIKEILATPSSHSSPCVFDNNIYYCHNIDPYKPSNVYSYDILSKKSTFLFDLKPYTMASPTIADKSLIINSEAKLVKYDLTNKNFKWTYNFPEPREYYSFTASPIVNENTIYAVSNSKLYSIDLESGKQNWNLKNDILTSPVYFNQLVYTTTMNNLLAVDSKTGNIVWKVPIKNNGWSMEPSVLIIDSKGNSYHSSISGEKQ